MHCYHFFLCHEDVLGEIIMRHWLKLVKRIPCFSLAHQTRKCIAVYPLYSFTWSIFFGSFLEGYSGVVEPSECIHISDKAKAIAKVRYYFFTDLTMSRRTMMWPVCNRAFALCRLFRLMYGSRHCQYMISVSTLGRFSYLFICCF